MYHLLTEFYFRKYFDADEICNIGLRLIDLVEMIILDSVFLITVCLEISQKHQTRL